MFLILLGLEMNNSKEYSSRVLTVNSLFYREMINFCKGIYFAIRRKVYMSDGEPFNFSMSKFGKTELNIGAVSHIEYVTRHRVTYASLHSMFRLLPSHYTVCTMICLLFLSIMIIPYISVHISWNGQLLLLYFLILHHEAAKINKYKS